MLNFGWLPPGPSSYTFSDKAGAFALSPNHSDTTKCSPGLDMNLTELKKMPVPELNELAQSMNIEGVARSRKQDLIFAILKAHAKKGEDIHGDGVLEILSDGLVFCVRMTRYLAGPDDIYVSPARSAVSACGTGDTISGKIRPPKDNERYFAMLRSMRSTSTSRKTRRTRFCSRTSPRCSPTKAVSSRGRQRQHRDITARTIELVAPIGKGQRGLIVSPPKAGKRRC